MPARSRLPSARVSPKLAKSVRSPGLAICRTSVLCSSPSAPRLTSLTIQATSPLPQREEPAREYRLPLSHPQSRDSPVNYGERHRAGRRVGTALTEGTANFLVNRRMAKSQQMRWSRRGADRLLLRVRCAVYNGTLGTGFGQRFRAAND